MEEEPQPVFKVLSLSKSPKTHKKRVWKSLKQILQTERSLKWPEDAITCKYKCLQKRMPTKLKHRTFIPRFIIERSSVIQTSEKVFGYFGTHRILHRPSNKTALPQFGGVPNDKNPSERPHSRIFDSQGSDQYRVI